MPINELIPIRPLSNRVRINIKTQNFNKKLFQIRFWHSKKGFQLFVEPYTLDQRGLLSHVTHSINSTTASLLPGGAKTSHIVKYSHTIDGLAHFSESGKIYSKIRKQSKLLTDKSCGQLFTVMCCNLNAFQDVNDVKANKGQDVNLEPSDTDVEDKMIRLTAFWYHSSVVRQSKPGRYGPKLSWIIDDLPRDVFILSPNTDDAYLHQCMLMLSYELIDMPKDPTPFSLMGGFDPRNRLNSKEYKFLCMVYPAPKNSEVKKLKSIDFIKPLPDQII